MVQIVFNHVAGKPPFFDGTCYDYWKRKMKMCLDQSITKCEMLRMLIIRGGLKELTPNQVLGEVMI
jgi:hypothetical protein